jgi:hypothetical protein
VKAVPLRARRHLGGRVRIPRTELADRVDLVIDVLVDEHCVAVAELDRELGQRRPDTKGVVHAAIIAAVAASDRPDDEEMPLVFAELQLFTNRGQDVWVARRGTEILDAGRPRAS